MNFPRCVINVTSLLLGVCLIFSSCSDAASPAQTSLPLDSGTHAQLATSMTPQAVDAAPPRTDSAQRVAADAAVNNPPPDAGSRHDAAVTMRSQDTGEDAGPVEKDHPLADNPEDAQGSSTALVKRMAPGWNLGNSLDACSSVASDSVDETTWGNPRVQEPLFAALKGYGIRSVRIPVTWRHHLGPAPDFAIEPAFMDRVQEVVDYALRNDLYAIINLHHDGGGDPESGAWIRDAATDYPGTQAKFLAIWTQIAARFQTYPHRLLFEAMNEVGFDTLAKTDGYARLNMLNQAFVDQIRKSGGHNPTRHVLIAGYWTDFAESSMGSVVPNDAAKRSILSVHYYTPWMFCVSADQPIWGSAQELDELRAKFQLLQSAFTSRGTPVILGEYGVIPKAERSSRLFWIEHVTKAAFELGIAPMFWDNGEELDRTSYQWRTVGLMETFLRATSGQDYEIKKQ